MAVSERTLSEFLQHSGRVLPDLAEGEVLLRRRDGEDLVLMTRAQSEALATTLRASFALSSGDAGAVQAVLYWFAFLSPQSQNECLRELREVGAAAVQTGRLSLLADTLYAWEATGLAAWDDRRRRERGEVPDEELVEIGRPGS